MEIEVYGIQAKRLGVARSFGEAKRMQQDSLPEDLKPAYAGIQDGGPLFYSHMLTADLLAKYPALDHD
jgi:hypothetical protein